LNFKCPLLFRNLPELNIVTLVDHKTAINMSLGPENKHFIGTGK